MREEPAGAELRSLREKVDDQSDRTTDDTIDDLVAYAKAKQLAAPAGSTTYVDILVISGGGDWGAFGAGVLKGWGQGDGRPRFDVVTGVSTGALIAPFAFVGEDRDIEHIVQLYRTPKKDWFRSRGWLYFLPDNPSFASTPGLERDLRASLDEQMIRRVADTAKTGRKLAVNTTDVDFGQMQTWDLGQEAQNAVEKGDAEHLYQVILASTAIPGFFPPRLIDDRLFVDGGITANIVFGQRSTGDRCFSAKWQAKHPGVKPPVLRYWLIFNNQLRFPPQTTQARWPEVIGRSAILSTQAATVMAIRYLFAESEIARLKYEADIEVRYIAVPDDFEMPDPKPFSAKTMNRLADLGEEMGRDIKAWSSEIP